MLLRRMLIRMCIRREDRRMLLQALEYSNSQYARRGNIERTNQTYATLQRVRPLLVRLPNFSYREVQSIVAQVREETTQDVLKAMSSAPHGEERRKQRRRGRCVGVPVAVGIIRVNKSAVEDEEKVTAPTPEPSKGEEGEESATSSEIHVSEENQ